MFKGKNVVVTGGSRGIGRAIAIEFGKKGANVVINYVSSDAEAEKVAEEIKSLGGNAILVKGDVSSFEEGKKLIDETVKVFGTIDILINNAGITKDGLIMRMKEEHFDKVIDINLKGVFNTCKSAVAHMLKQRSGKIINISSVVGVVGNAGQANYAASKAGVIGLTKSIAKEVGTRGITVNAVAPGFIKSDMTDVLSEKVKDGMLGLIPLNRFGNVEDVARTVVFLASEGGDYITGQVINVDGGMVM
ncbi:3-ketoacyl-ACP reductase [Clostridium sulfidigenes]|uniref:3-oxoacyl-[acyl-carrier-protein] reductase n=1 Tax=Clostridium sulfidigenes TaxID=318464 RepID=A0A084J8W4_9CLOT|nr:3-oxoacyl-[acyl-carrier-protein] reductase [Clostridium sulfidigenes]KEZ85398.1 3-ketoacyl-ACP reductase [Clostridium sulfidigenes]HCO74534.1 3-oxoacyl-[acyl-carrier-protein] reductase [Clostridium sp.]